MLWATSATADALEFSRIVLVLPPCSIEGVSEAELRAAAALELAAHDVSLAPPGEMSMTTDALVRVETSCAPGAELSLRVSFGDERRTRQLDLSALPARTRTRALALSLAEFVSLFRARSDDRVAPEPIELEEEPEEPPSAEAKPDPPAPAPSEPATSAAKSEPIGRTAPPPEPKRARTERLTELGLSPEARLFQRGSTVAGARLHVDAGQLGLGLSVLGSEIGVSSGTVSALIVHASGALRWLRTPDSETLALSAGPRVGVGLVRVSGVPGLGARGTSVQEAYLDAAGYGMLELRPGGGLRLGLALELGYARGMIALADDDIAGVFGGPFVGGLLDLSFAL